MSNETNTALIVGASRGLGLSLVREYLGRGWHVVATARGTHTNDLKALAAPAEGRLRIEPLDVVDAGAIAALARALGDVRLDLLFVSAGVSSDKGPVIGNVAPAEFMRVMLVNALAPLKIIETLDARVPRSGAIVAMSSILGSVAENTSGGKELYRSSKAALNSALRSYAARNPERSVVAMHPGWVRTDMGGPDADVGVDESAAGMADVIASRLGKPGCVFLDYEGRAIAW